MNWWSCFVITVEGWCIIDTQIGSIAWTTDE